MSRINGLRDQKKEIVSTFRGNIYGSFVGIALTVYISLLVSVVLFDVFGSVSQGLDGVALDLVGDIFPTDMEGNFELISIYIAVILVFQAFFSSFLVKEIDGGHPIASLFDACILLWIGALFEIGLTYAFTTMFSSYFGL